MSNVILFLIVGDVDFEIEKDYFAPIFDATRKHDNLKADFERTTFVA